MNADGVGSKCDFNMRNISANLGLKISFKFTVDDETNTADGELLKALRQACLNWHDISKAMLDLAKIKIDFLDLIGQI